MAARAIQQARFCKERGKLYANGAMQVAQVAEAIQYRTLDRRLWG
jgi:hypothetical protein